MLLIREFEPEAERQYKKARIGGYCHLATGQEAATVGAVSALQDDDYLLASYRDHGLALARGVSARAVMAELFGRVDGCAHGRGGSMHLLDVGAQLPRRLGHRRRADARRDRRRALHRARRRQQAVLCELGDGATNIGAWHESLNLAGVWQLPIVFLVMNNVYGMGTSVERASAEPELYKRAAAYRMHGERVDGNDLEAVIEASEELLASARRDREPAVLELMTYRYRGHSVADAGLAYRTKDEISEHRAEHDPIELRRARSSSSASSSTRTTSRRSTGAAEERVRTRSRSPRTAPRPTSTRSPSTSTATRRAEQFARMRPAARSARRPGLRAGLAS